MDSFVRPGRLDGRDGRFQINNSQIDRPAFQFLQRSTPDVIEGHRPRNRAVGFIGKIDIVARIANVGLVQNRIRWMGQRLIDAAAGHHVAAEKQTQ